MCKNRAKVFRQSTARVGFEYRSGAGACAGWGWCLSCASDPRDVCPLGVCWGCRAGGAVRGRGARQAGGGLGLSGGWESPRATLWGWGAPLHYTTQTPANSQSLKSASQYKSISLRCRFANATSTQRQCSRLFAGIWQDWHRFGRILAEFWQNFGRTLAEKETTCKNCAKMTGKWQK